MKEYIKPAYEYVELRPEERLAGSCQKCIIKVFCISGNPKRSCFKPNYLFFK